jgi:hypothetical protein
VVRVNCKIQYVAMECWECGSMVGKGGSNLQLLCTDKTFTSYKQGLREFCATCKSVCFTLVIAQTRKGGRAPRLIHKVDN